MKAYLTYAAALIVALAAVAGCANRFKSQVAPEPPPADVQAPDNAYYLFTESVLHRKRGDLALASAFLRQALELDPESVFLQRELAELYVEQKAPDQALAVLETILDHSPMEIETLILFGSLNQDLNRMDAAKEAFERVLAGDPKREEIYTALGQIYLAEDDLENATRVFEQMLDYFPASYVGHFYLGRIHAREGRTAEAETEFEKSLLLEPSLLEPRFELIELLKAKGFVGETLTLSKGETIGDLGRKRYGRYGPSVEKAILTANPQLKSADDVRAGQRIRFPSPPTLPTGGRTQTTNDQIILLYEEILDANPASVRAAVELGLFLDEIGRNAEAEEVLEDLGSRSRNERVVLTSIVRQFFEEGRYREVWTALQYMLKGAGDNPDLHYVSGLALSEMGQREKAIDHFGRVGPQSRFYENAVINTALIHQEQGRLDEAVALLEEALDRMPGNADLMFFLGTILEEDKDYPGAEAVLKRAIDIDPQNTKYHFRLGVVYDKWGQKEACIAAMRTVIELDPNHANALNYLGYTFADLGRNLEEAEALIQRALEQKPDDGYITDSLGWVYYRMGDYQRALELIQKAVDLVPEDPTILEHLGDVYLRLEHPEKALKYYRRSLENRTEDKAGIEEKIRSLTEDAQVLP